jgi:protein O-mannosyl-transferase
MGSRFVNPGNEPNRTSQSVYSGKQRPVESPVVTRRDLVAAILLVALNLIVFSQILRHEFLGFDDAVFVYQNEHVNRGFSADSVRWAFTATDRGWYPLTWLSHMLDVELFGLKPAGHFASALLFHILATLAVFLAVRLLTAAEGGRPHTIPSAVVAALFAIHPMHVESVAWVSERRDTLSTLFGMLALAAYARRRHVLVAIAFLASLLAKQTLVTLPFALLLLDWWPLGRLPREWRRAVLEKIPLFAITLLGVWMAVAGQKSMGAMSTTEIVPLFLRLSNAAVAYASYLQKLVWPVDLAVIYPLRVVTSGEVALSVMVLFAITAAAFVFRRKAPYLLMGWLFFLGTLVPVIGLVQIGAQSMADRYTYVPYIGLFIAAVWGIRDLARHFALDPRAAFAAAAAIIAILAAQAWQQTRHWKNTVTLFEHTLAVTGPNPIAEYTLGQALQMTAPDRAIPHFRRIIEIADTIRRGVPPYLYAQSHIGLGTSLLNQARATKDPAAALPLIDEAAGAYRKAIQADPQNSGPAQRNLTLAATMREAYAKATPPATTNPAPAMKPDPAVGDKEVDKLLDQGVAAMNARNMDAAIAVFRQAVDRQPASVATRMYLGLAYIRMARNAEAAAELQKAHEIDPLRANEYITRALKMPPGPRNLEDVIAGLR